MAQTKGMYLFAIAGAFSGLIAVLVMDGFRRAARLTEVRVYVPQLSEMTFVVNNDARQVAWQLFVESVTRISTQRLDSEAGLLREALSSLYSLFASTRETLKASRPSVAGGGPTVEYLAVALLNIELRPFLSKWHPRLKNHERDFPDRPEADWPEAAECRRELNQLQENARSYVLAFARLAGVHDAGEMLGAPTRQP
ncbi:hypothetical protein ACQEVX_05350 [Streptomyces syringium]|uniref:hypothetical protein n=1 Tax=Streptomyces syringium TaxID=76729 RepID=UPI003D8A7881